MWVHWLSAGSRRHRTARVFVEERLAAGERLALVPQVLHEVLHVMTDARRVDPPATMAAAIDALGRLWESAEVQRIVPSENVLPRTLELLLRYRLGRKRILDTALAATLEQAGVRRLATFNGTDFQVFDFLEVVEPGKAGPPPR